jgi:putative hydrolases of HD superfamily
MALVLAPYSNEAVDIAKVVEMLVVHDLVEIDAGDTFVYDTEAREAKAELEQRAADRLFALIPGEVGIRLRARWDEFEASETPEARFAHSVDRLSPLLLNHANRGELWAEYGITSERVVAYNAHIADGSTDLWTAARTVIDDAVANGWIAEN